VAGSYAKVSRARVHALPTRKQPTRSGYAVANTAPSNGSGTSSRRLPSHDTRCTRLRPPSRSWTYIASWPIEKPSITASLSGTKSRAVASVPFAASKTRMR
jgi:hypothetical protein